MSSKPLFERFGRAHHHPKGYISRNSCPTLKKRFATLFVANLLASIAR